MVAAFRGSDSGVRNGVDDTGVGSFFNSGTGAGTGGALAEGDLAPDQRPGGERFAERDVRLRDPDRSQRHEQDEEHRQVAGQRCKRELEPATPHEPAGLVAEHDEAC